MQLADIDMKDRAGDHLSRGKGGKARTVPFHVPRPPALDRYLRLRRTHRCRRPRHCGSVTAARTFSIRLAGGRWATGSTVAGIERFHPHLLRHTAATRWLSAGGSEGGLMAVAGWSSSRDARQIHQGHRDVWLAAAEARKLNLGDLGV